MYTVDDNKLKKHGNNVRKARQPLYRSQEKLAGKLGVNRERISRLECGRHTPCPFLLLEIAKACSVSLETLFDDLDD